MRKSNNMPIKQFEQVETPTIKPSNKFTLLSCDSESGDETTISEEPTHMYENSDHKWTITKDNNRSNTNNFKRRGDESEMRNNPNKRWGNESDMRSNPKRWGNESEMRNNSNKRWGGESEMRNNSNKRWGDESEMRNNSNKKWGDESEMRNNSNKKWGDESEIKNNSKRWSGESEEILSNNSNRRWGGESEREMNNNSNKRWNNEGETNKKWGNNEWSTKRKRPPMIREEKPLYIEGIEGTKCTKVTEGIEGTKCTKVTEGTEGTEGTKGTEDTKSTEGTTSISEEEFGNTEYLNSPWTVWIHKTDCNVWREQDYKNIYVIDSIGSFWRFFNNFHLLDKATNQIFIMRNQIKPIFEDNENRKGGRCSIKLNCYSRHGKIDIGSEVMTCICLLMMNETLIPGNNKINGISYDIRHRSVYIKIWCKDGSIDIIESLPVSFFNKLNMLLKASDKGNNFGRQKYESKISLVWSQIEPEDEPPEE